MVRQFVVILAFVVILISTAAFAQEPPTFLGCSQFGELFSINLDGPSAALIANMSEPLLATEIEFDVDTGTLWAEQAAIGQNLYMIDPDTGASSGFVVHSFGALNGLEFVGTTLYGTFFIGQQGSSDLVIVDTSTGGLTMIGPTGFGPISGLAYDEISNVMYGVTAGEAPSDLVTIDLTTGAATLVGSTDLERIGSIEFGTDGYLYGGVSRNGGDLANHLVRIDIDTGAATVLFDTGFSITGLTATTAVSLVPQIHIDVKPNSCPNPHSRFGC